MVYVSSFKRRPRIVLPSRVTATALRLAGIRYRAGSSSVRCRDAGERIAPISLRSDARRGPRPLIRWHEAQPPLPEYKACPREASQNFTDALASKPALI